MAKQSGTTMTSSASNPRGMSSNALPQVNEWARPLLANAASHTTIEKDAVVMYKDVMDASDAYTRYAVIEDRGDRVLMADMNHSTALGPTNVVAFKNDLKLYRKNK